MKRSSIPNSRLQFKTPSPRTIQRELAIVYSVDSQFAHQELWNQEMSQELTPAIRRASPRDAGLLSELGARTFSETFAADNAPENMAAYLAAAFGTEKQWEELADPQSTFLIAEIDGVAAGYAKLHPGYALDGVSGESPIEIVRLYVSRAWLGRGVGEALMRACIDEGRKAGHRTIWLGVWEHNPRARAFYRKWDFREVGQHVFQLGSDPQTDVLMQREL